MEQEEHTVVHVPAAAEGRCSLLIGDGLLPDFSGEGVV